MAEFRPAAESSESRDAAAPDTAAAAEEARSFSSLRGLGKRLRVRGPSSSLTPPSPRRRRSGWRVAFGLFKVVLAIAVVAVVGAAGLIAWAVYDVPLDRSTVAPTTPSIAIEAADGSSLGRRGAFKVADVALADFPPTLVNAVLSIEDRRYYSHPGVDIAGIARAFNDNVAAGRVVEGGSTITQQLVKGMLGDDERTMRRKLREALVAVALELRLGKDEILRRYLNTVYMGGGAFGMPAAAQLYFKKSVGALTLAESAMLAGLVQGPSQLNPLVNLPGAQARAGMVLDAMHDNGVIDAVAATTGKAQPAAPVQSAQPGSDGTWFADWIADGAAGFAGSNGAPLRVRTTLVPQLQTAAEQAVRDAMAKLPATAKVSQAAMVAMRPDGAVVAMVGGRDYQASQFNRAAQAKRQPGSSFKLFVYLAALRNGYTVDSTVEDSPLSIRDPSTGKSWSPDNYGGTYAGTVTLGDAFARSLNTAAVRLAVAVGPDKVVAAARDLGIDAPLTAYPSIALGTSEVTLVDLTAAYASVLSGAMPVQPWGITGVGAAGKDGLLLSAASPVDKSKPLDHRAELISLLQGVVDRGTARGAALPGFAAGKTGTSQDYHDAWFIGFDSSLVVGVWVGNDDNSPMEKITGGSLPASIWKAFMTAAKPFEPGLTQPSAPVTAPAGTIAPNGIPLAGALPAASCDLNACAANYVSFRASDCTYQPYDGSARRLCTKGIPSSTIPVAALPPVNVSPIPPPPFPPVAVATPAPALPGSPPVQAAPPANVTASPAPARNDGGFCDVQACTATYSSFRESDCTYQPLGGGPRLLCTRTATTGTGQFTTQAQIPPADVGRPQPQVPLQVPAQAAPATPLPPPPQGQQRPPAAQSVPQSVLDWLSRQP